MSNGNFDGLFIAELTGLYRKGHASLQSLFVDVAESNATLPRRHELIGVCKQVFTHREHTHTQQKTLRDIQAGQLRSIAGIKPEWIQFWCKKLDLTIELNSVESSDSLCRFFFELNPQFQEPSYTLLKRLLKAKENALPSWTDWEYDLQEAKWHEKPGWRLLFIEHTPEKPLQDLDGDAETMFLKMSNLEMRAKLLRLGFLVEPSYFDGLTLESFELLSSETQSILVWYGLHFAEDKLGETVARGWVIAAGPQDRTALRSELSSAFSMFSSLVQQVSDYFEETPTTTPQQMTPTEWVKEYLLTLPKKSNVSVYSLTNVCSKQGQRLLRHWGKHAQIYRSHCNPWERSDFDKVTISTDTLTRGLQSLPRSTTMETKRSPLVQDDVSDSVFSKGFCLVAIQRVP